MAEEVTEGARLAFSASAQGRESHFDADISRAEAATLIYGLMDKFGLIYDLAQAQLSRSSAERACARCHGGSK
ncbi:MAG: hypothetical protein ACOX34_06815 [Bacillota bacterium]